MNFRNLSAPVPRHWGNSIKGLFICPQPLPPLKGEIPREGQHAHPCEGQHAHPSVGPLRAEWALARGMGTHRAAVGACYLWDREAVERSLRVNDGERAFRSTL